LGGVKWTLHGALPSGTWGVVALGACTALMEAAGRTGEPGFAKTNHNQVTFSSTGSYLADVQH